MAPLAPPSGRLECNTFWGTHGCHKPAGHVEAGDPTHRCGSAEEPCSEAISDPQQGARARYFEVGDDGELLRPLQTSDWMSTRFFSVGEKP